MRLIHLVIIIGGVITVLVITQILLEVNLENDLDRMFVPPHYFYDNLFKEVTHPVVLWWAPLGGPDVPGRVRQCGPHACYFTNDRQFRLHPQTKALMFYGSGTKLTDLPLPRNNTVLWALLHEESPRNNPPLTHLPILSLFNFTATFSRHSSFPITTQYLSSLQVLTDLKYFVSTEEKNRLQKEKGLAPVLYLQSDCSTPINRDTYVAELAKHIPVDSYGECLHNKDLPPHLQSHHSLDTMMSDDLLHVVAKYKFALAFENGICHDYVTEKLWRPLISGSVPVYIGSPTVSGVELCLKSFPSASDYQDCTIFRGAPRADVDLWTIYVDWLPNNKSAVLGIDFSSPKALARYLNYLNNHDEEYNSYLSHKLKAELTNTILIQTMEERVWDTDWSTEKGDFIETFGCFVCEKAHNFSGVSIANSDHYLCPMPVSIVSHMPNSSNFWLDIWFHSQCEAEVTRAFIDLGVDEIRDDEYEADLSNLVLKNKCSYSG